jgi:hypothetical protein
MKSIRSCLFATLLALSALGQFAGMAQAQETMQGKFTLPHEVRWEKAVVPAGEYGFSLQPVGSLKVLILQKVGGASGYGFIMVVHSSESIQPTNLNELVLVTKGDQTFVSSMQMARSGVAFYFAVPDEPQHSGKQIARAEAVVASPSAR